jgi:hypothetical protein
MWWTSVTFRQPQPGKRQPLHGQGAVAPLGLRVVELCDVAQHGALVLGDDPLTQGHHMDERSARQTVVCRAITARRLHGWAPGWKWRPVARAA